MLINKMLSTVYDCVYKVYKVQDVYKVYKGVYDFLKSYTFLMH